MKTRALSFTTDAGVHEAELVTPPNPSWTVVLCHGIPGGRPAPGDTGYAGLARALADRGIEAMWFDFRGCRTGPGDFSIDGWQRDLSAALDAVAPVAQAPIAIAASSAGGTVGIRVAANRSDVRAIATLAAPASMEDLATDPAATLQRFRNIGLIRDPAFPVDPAAWAAEFATVTAIGPVASIGPRPLLLIHGDADEIVPYHHAETLFEQAAEPKELVRIPGGSHQLRKDPRALDALVDWLERHKS